MLACLAVGAVESVGGGSDSVDVEARLSMPAYNGSTVGPGREVAECSCSLSCNGDHEGTFFQGYFLPPCVATATSALGVGHFCEEDGGG